VAITNRGVETTTSSQATDAWTPPLRWGERLKYGLIPPRLYMSHLVRKHLRRGDPELWLLPAVVPRDKIAIDIGANKGVYTHVLSGLCRAVHAFEPNPKMFGILSRHGALPPNATAYQVALSNASGTAELIIPKHKGHFSDQHPSLNPRKKTEGHGVVHVETRTLDSYAFTGVGFLKIDVEGFEAAVVQGAADTIRRERPTLLVEMEERHTGEPIEAALGRMQQQFGLTGYFLRDGRLRPLEDFHPEQDHRKPANRASYVFNFLFRPAELAPLDASAVKLRPPRR